MVFDGWRDQSGTAWYDNSRAWINNWKCKEVIAEAGPNEQVSEDYEYLLFIWLLNIFCSNHQ